ncbi:MAG: zf-TFIIB domain-containing protein [Candidatus Omnitrophota bacterium]|nr:MAG: zf-TFIIB domain-containing protein [Candidatus Omnitrophota bacterium]
MECLLCSSDMAVKNYEGADIDVCKSCEGVWLDSGELEKIVNTKEEKFTVGQVKKAIESAVKEENSRHALMKDIKSFKRDINLDELDSDQILRIFKKRWGIDRKLNCPKCFQALQELNYAGADVILDKCPDKHGFWLDRQELGKVQIMMEYYNKTAVPDTEHKQSKPGWFDVVSHIVKKVIP